MRQTHFRKSPEEFKIEIPCTRNHIDGRKVVAVDFDGTLVHNEYPFISNPDMELINFIKNHREEYTWILWTCRHDQQLKYAVDYMKDEHGIVFDFVNENIPSQIEAYGDCRKIWATYYLDDKNVHSKFFTEKVDRNRTE